MTLRAQIGKPILFHLCCWHGKDGSSIPGYDSRDPNVIGDQLSAMQVLGGPDTGVVALSYGVKSTFIHAAVMEVCRQCNERRMPFALCYDPQTVKGTTDPTAALIAEIQQPDTQWMLNSRSYLEGRPVLEFNTGVHASAVASATGVATWSQNVDYSWIYLPDPLGPLKKNNALPTMKLPAVALQFDDGTGADRNKSCWDQSKPRRFADARAGGLFWDMVGLIPKQAKYVQVVTWNDYNEGTVVEPWASMMTGRIG